MFDSDKVLKLTDDMKEDLKRGILEDLAFESNKIEKKEMLEGTSKSNRFSVKRCLQQVQKKKKRMSEIDETGLHFTLKDK